MNMWIDRLMSAYSICSSSKEASCQTTLYISLPLYIYMYIYIQTHTHTSVFCICIYRYTYMYIYIYILYTLCYTLEVTFFTLNRVFHMIHYILCFIYAIYIYVYINVYIYIHTLFIWLVGYYTLSIFGSAPIPQQVRGS